MISVNKAVFPALILVAGFAGGMVTSKKLEKPIKIPTYKCPDCNCPPATEVKLQNFDLSKLNNKKGNFTYSPQLHNVMIRIDACDSVMLDQIRLQTDE